VTKFITLDTCHLPLGIVNASLESQWGFDVLGRAGGLATPEALVYVVGGYSWEEWEGNLAIPLAGIGLTADEDASGWTIGAGVEVKLANNMSVKGRVPLYRLRQLRFRHRRSR
jgi:outer membrane immunogenic protein